MQSIPEAVNSQLAGSVVKVLITLLFSIFINNLLRSFIKIPKNFDSRRSRTYAAVLQNAITIAVYAVALHIIFMELGINITPLLASAGIIGITVGIGARAMIEDLISGLFMLTQDTIAVGDYVKLDTVEGTIEKIGIRSLTIRMDNGALCIIPNGLVKIIVNFSRHRSYTPVDLVVKADQDIDTTIKAMKEALESLIKVENKNGKVYPESMINGIDDFKVDGRMILRATVITSPNIRAETVRRYRYLAKKNFEKYKILLA